MKKYLVIIMASVVFMIAGCKKNDSNNPGNSGGNEPGGDEPQTELVSPVIVSKELARINGFNTLFVKFNNPNNVPIDYEFDVELLSDGIVAGICEDLCCIAHPAGEDMMILHDYGIPNNTNGIIIKDLTYGNTLYNPVKLNIIKEEKDENNNLILGLTAEKSFDYAYVYVVFYYDNQIVAHGWKEFFTGDELECVIKVLENYNRYEIFKSAYSEP